MFVHVWGAFQMVMTWPLRMILNQPPMMIVDEQLTVVRLLQQCLCSALCQNMTPRHAQP